MMTSFEFVDDLASHKELKWKMFGIYIRSYISRSDDIAFCLCPVTAKYYLMTNILIQGFMAPAMGVYNKVGLTKELMKEIVDAADGISAPLRDYMIEKLINRDVCNNAQN